MTLHALFCFFKIFQSKHAIQKSKNVCLYGRNTYDKMGEFFSAFDLYAPLYKLFYQMLRKPKHLLKKVRKQSHLFFLVKKLKTVNFEPKITEH